MKLGEYIKKYRDEHDKMSYRAFAALVGLSPQYVINLEKGLNNDGKELSATMDTYAKIAKGTGISETELLLMLDDSVTVNPDLSNREFVLVQKFRKADEGKKQAVEAVLDGVSLRETKIIPLFGSSFAAGSFEPGTQDDPFEDYEVDADSKAEFAIRISGDSMEPELHDGQIALCTKRRPQIGEIVVCLVNGSFYVKQFITDGRNIYLRSLNRKRKDCDIDIWASGDYTVKCFGTVIHKRVPLVQQ